METELHITIHNAGDPERLSQLLKAAIEVQKPVMKVMVPTGYRCIECDSGDGGHSAGCSMIIANQVKEQDPEERG